MTAVRIRLVPRAAFGFAAITALLLSPLGSPPASAATLPVVDDFEAPLAAGSAGAVPIGFFVAQDPKSTTSFTRGTTPPEPVPGSAAGNSVLQTTFTVSSYGVVLHAFEDPTVTKWLSQDWSASAGLQLSLYGTASGTDLFVDVLDNRNPGSVVDDAERWTATFKDSFTGWQVIQLPFADMTRKEVGNGAPNDGFGLTEVHAWALGALTTTGPLTLFADDVALYGTAPERPLTVGFASTDTQVTEGATAAIGLKLSKPSAEPVTVDYATTTGTARPDRDYVPTNGTVTFAPNQTRATIPVTTIDDSAYQGDRGVVLELSSPRGAAMGKPPVTRLQVLDDESYDPTLVEGFESGAFLWNAGQGTRLATTEIPAGDPSAVPGQGAYEQVLSATTKSKNVAVRRPFAQAQDWSASHGVEFWYLGHNSRQTVTVGVENNKTMPSDADPAEWKLAWSDEFSGKSGTAPDPSIWTHEIGDGTIIGKPGWGNDELEYYTDSTDNAALNGDGQLVLTTRATDPATAPQCYYGPCAYTSARLVTQKKAEFAYGRIETRVQVPRGSGLWPAIWALGTDIDRNAWPQSGEIDIMENVGRMPNRGFGTIHGPGYSGGQSFGGTYDFSQAVADTFHTFSVQWSPDHIEWFVDGIKFHDASPADVTPNQWVFNHPFSLLMNVAVGGNFGGAVSADTVFPQSMKVDYLRVYQAKPRPVQFNASFKDDFTGWQRVSIPFEQFANKHRATLDLTDVRALTVSTDARSAKPLLLDEVRLSCATQVPVTSAADSGPGSLRRALGSVCAGGTVSLAASLAGARITNSSELTIAKDVTVDATAAPGVTVSGNGAVRGFVVTKGVHATITGLTISDGYGFELAGGILNNGDLTLDRSVVSGNAITTSGNDYWKGGGGIYNGDGATLTVRDSTVADNTVTDGPGGGILSFFNSTLTIERSTLSGNTATDVGGAIRSLSNATITNSTISGNTATGWHGGGVFQTDGIMTISSSTLTGNTSPGGTASAAFVGTFGNSGASLTLLNTIVAGNSGQQCMIAPYGSGAVSLTSLGHNVIGDDSCGAPAGGDLTAADPVLGPLAANGGPTWTHALRTGSPAIDAADPDASPATDQRGTARPQGAGPDVGAFELG